MWAKWATRGAKAHEPDVTPPDAANDGETGKRDKERRPSIRGRKCRREEARKHTKKKRTKKQKRGEGERTEGLGRDVAQEARGNRSEERGKPR